MSYRANLVAKTEGPTGNWTTIELRNSGTELQAKTSGSRLTGGSDARDLPPGTIATIFGTDLAGTTASIEEGVELPTELAGVQVLSNGRLSPLLMVSPDQITFQVPWELEGTGFSFYVRRTMPDGSVAVSAARANQSVRAAPGLFEWPGDEPRLGMAVHASGFAEGTVAVTLPDRPRDDDPNNDLTENRQLSQEGAEGRIVVNGREYAYRSPGDESPEQIRDHFIELINAGDGDPDVVASAGTVGFFSARADFEFGGEPAAGDTVTITVRDRSYSYTLTEEDVVNPAGALLIMRNILVRSINAGVGDPEVTARALQVVGSVRMQIVARSLGSDGNDIPYGFEVSSGAGITADTNRENGFLEDGNTPPVVVLQAREAGKAGNEITYAATGTVVPPDDPGHAGRERARRGRRAAHPVGAQLAPVLRERAVLADHRGESARARRADHRVRHGPRPDRQPGSHRDRDADRCRDRRQRPARGRRLRLVTVRRADRAGRVRRPDGGFGGRVPGQPAHQHGFGGQSRHAAVDRPGAVHQQRDQPSREEPRAAAAGRLLGAPARPEARIRRAPRQPLGRWGALTRLRPRFRHPPIRRERPVQCDRAMGPSLAAAGPGRRPEGPGGSDMRHLAVALSAASIAVAPAAERVEFNRDIRPILSQNCFACHGPDRNARQADLRLDRREEVLARGVIQPGDASGSRLVDRIRQSSPVLVMPPVATDKRLSDREKELIETWIEQGAEYQEHWAYIRPQRPDAPDGPAAIDHLVNARLAEQGPAARGGG